MGISIKRKSLFDGIKLTVGKINPNDPEIKKIARNANIRIYTNNNSIPTGKRLQKLLSEVVRKKAA